MTAIRSSTGAPTIHPSSALEAQAETSPAAGAGGFDGVAAVRAAVTEADAFEARTGIKPLPSDRARFEESSIAGRRAEFVLAKGEYSPEIARAVWRDAQLAGVHAPDVKDGLRGVFEHGFAELVGTRKDGKPEGLELQFSADGRVLQASIYREGVLRERHSDTAIETFNERGELAQRQYKNLQGTGFSSVVTRYEGDLQLTSFTSRYTGDQVTKPGPWQH